MFVDKKFLCDHGFWVTHGSLISCFAQYGNTTAIETVAQLVTPSPG